MQLPFFQLIDADEDFVDDEGQVIAVFYVLDMFGVMIGTLMIVREVLNATQQG